MRATIHSCSENTESFTAVPFLLSIGYRFFIMSDLFIMPVISGGGIYISMDQNDEKTTSVQNLMRAGVRVGYVVWRGLYVQVNAEYNAMIEKDGLVSFMTCNIGVGRRI
ncbi:hypothetical protein ACFL20_10115 [Spirochaetota bacterium]